MISSYCKAWKNPIPMNLGHDRCKPIGVTELTGIYLELGKAYLTNISKMADSPKEMEDIVKLIHMWDYKVYSVEHRHELKIASA